MNQNGARSIRSSTGPPIPVLRAAITVHLRITFASPLLFCHRYISFSVAWFLGDFDETRTSKRDLRGDLFSYLPSSFSDSSQETDTVFVSRETRGSTAAIWIGVENGALLVGLFAGRAKGQENSSRECDRRCPPRNRNAVGPAGGTTKRRRGERSLHRRRRRFVTVPRGNRGRGGERKRE